MKVDPLPLLSDDELHVCWFAALAFGDENRSAFNPQPEPITHLGTALRECIRRAIKMHDPEEDTGLFDARVCRVCGCTDDAACVGEDGIPCHWVEWDLCSQCEAVDARRSLEKRQAVITMNVSPGPPGFCMHCGMPR